MPLGAELCTPDLVTEVSGCVSVFLPAVAMEGCSRLAEDGSRQILLEYREFDRCLWLTTP